MAATATAAMRIAAATPPATAPIFQGLVDEACFDR
jgi:hypothetical protein